MNRLEGLRTWWEGLTNRQRGLTAAGAGAAVIAVSLVVSLVGRQTGGAALYSNLTPEDLSLASAELAKAGIPHEPLTDTGAIRVQEKDTAQARMVLAHAGLPRSGDFSVPGFELLDNTSFASSDFLQRANYVRALQGELSRSISTLESVVSARVHLNLPEQSVFEERRQKPSASVMVSLKPGQVLTSAQTQAIVAMVTRAVEGLGPDEVALVDTAGTVLWARGLEGSSLADGVEHLALRGRVEQQIAQRMQAFLDRALGAGKSWVQVSVELDTETRTTERENYVTQEGLDKGVPLSQSTVTEQYLAQGGKADGKASGAAGAVSNLQIGAPTGGARPAAFKDGTYSRTEEDTQWGVGKEIQRITSPAGSIKSVSVAVFVSDDIPKGQVSAVEQAIGAAAGIRADRGDTVTVVPVSLPEASDAKGKGAGLGPATIPAKWVAAGGAPLLLLMTIVPMLIRRRRRRAEQALEAARDHTDAFESDGARHEGEEVSLPPEAQGVDRLRQHVREDPRRVADLLRGWTGRNASSAWLSGQVAQGGGPWTREDGSNGPNGSNN